MRKFSCFNFQDQRLFNLVYGMDSFSIDCVTGLTNSFRLVAFDRLNCVQVFTFYATGGCLSK